ncbi:MAG: HNH endonuclease [Nocardioides sp.]
MAISVTHKARPDTAAGVLRAARDRRRAADLAEAELLQLAVEWALMHPADSIHRAAGRVLRGFGQTELALAGEGAPAIAEFEVAELASTVGLSTEAGKRYLGEALELCYRLPALWRRVTSGDLPAWKARRVARETLRLSRDAAAYVDTHVAPVAHKLTPAQLDRVVNEAIGRFMPDEVERLAAESWDKRHVTVHDRLVSFTGTMRVEAELDIADALDFDAAVAAGAAQHLELGSTESCDVRRAQAVGDLARGQLPLDVGTAGPSSDAARPPRPQARQVVLHVHLSEAAVRGDDPVARLERGDSLVSVDHVRAWCGNPSAEVVVKPVLDLAGCTWSDSDQVPESIAEQVAVRDHTCVFPWCTRPARRCHHDDHPCDDDHVVARGGAGPTCSCNIAPLCRRHHRLKTHSPWSYLVLDPGTYLWTTPHGYQFLRDETGTLDVSRDRPRLPDS